MLIKVTPQGADDVESLGQVIGAMRESLEAVGGTLTAAVITLGAYDVVTIGTIDSDEKLAWFASGMMADGKVNVETLLGFAPEDWAGVQGIVGPDRRWPFHWAPT